ncbi:hypothetical protein AGDE_01685 [Angomonas deanei]|nr:hypothetical protein AGDE_05895 [Angomonas deanei]EPY42238.1 hypothetical protein AGDE_01685 [Angomonas deanei]|eukprot:EPY38037.1 hypothetical protein AGDE_05895 [Angomonas deanei]
MATMFTLIALVLTIVRLAGKTSYVWSMIFGFFGFMWALCGNALSISLFHIGRCNEPRLANVARLDAGFALSLIAWILLMVGLLVMTFVTQCNFGPAIRHVRVMDSFYLLLLIMVIALCAIGNVTTIWKRHFGDDKVRVVRVSYWHTEVILADGVNLIYGRAAYRCSAYNKRIKASVSFLILATVFFAIAAFLAIPAFFKRGMRILSLCLSITACVMLLISWVIAVVVKYRKLCENDVGGTVYENYPGVPTGVFNGYTKFEGYGLAEGVVLQIVAWILSLLAIILNFAIPWPAKK